MSAQHITLPFTGRDLAGLRAGQRLYVSGTLYTARDQAHKRLAEALKLGKRPPFDLKTAVIYYCGPTKTPKGKRIGSCGPTTSCRMDAFTPALLDAGLKAMIGKGNRSENVLARMKKRKAVYFLTYAGCGALLAKQVVALKAVAYKDLGPEAVYRLTVKDFPLIVGVDTKGRNVYGKD
ncbi:MAG TPA: FumA C-terminus/TtdB family hydratase beta subunit [Patescibacteria group bacterium]|nr:FumA C-terminus/TtdB family hydratase beta subunit [Patescibacteria group bacterium]